MLHTFEMRWFFSEVPLDAAAHFSTDGDLQVRTDWYALPCRPSWGVKLREGRMETKIRVATHGKLNLGPFRGCLESYRKWSLQFPEDDQPGLDDLEAANWIAVEKRRHLKRFSVEGDHVATTDIRPANGCEFELTKLDVNQRVYWTVGFEAVGGASSLADNLQRVADQVASQGGLWQPFDESHSFGYAQWLAEVI